jgi:hypothetical protein
VPYDVTERQAHRSCLSRNASMSAARAMP